jgi:hypothetical protein
MFANHCFRLATHHLIVASLVAIFVSVLPAEELKILYRNGTELTGTLPESTLDWVTVSSNGNLVDRKVKLAEIKSLTLSRDKSSELLAQIRQSITRLGDADFSVREKAEAELALRGGQFKNLLKQMENSSSMEVRHRVGRLLAGFSKKVYPPLSLDTLVLSNGRTLEGEARNFSLVGEYRGTPISLDRQTVAELFQKKPPADEEAMTSDPEPVRTEIFHQHSDFVSPNQRTFAFETDANGEPFRDRANINSAFVKNGLVFRNEQEGYVGVSVFSFKYDDLPVGGRSVCLYGQGRSRKQFQGFMEISFCVPGRPSLPAGVKEVGLFIARVKHSRDIVMEAYNAQGNVLATVEATDQQCVFAGVKSNELITRLRIFSNPWLKKLSRKVDVDFAIDTLRMSEPIAVPSVTGRVIGRRQVELTNGDRFSGSVNTAGDGNLRVHVSGVAERTVRFDLKPEELASIHLSYPAAKPSSANQWKAMLEDGSIVHVAPGDAMKSELLNDEFSSADLVGLWKANSPGRYPLAGDWKSDQALVVFPTCRIHSDPFTLGNRKISWTINNKIEQTLMLGREDPNAEENQEDPTPSETSFVYANTLANQLPTFWNKQPLIFDTGPATGVVELTDGQRFLFGERKPFQFDALANREVRLTWMEENPINIPLKNIRTIIFPR